MTNIIIYITIIAALLGFAVSIWSYIDTRNKYYVTYLNRKNKK